MKIITRAAVSVIHQGMSIEMAERELRKAVIEEALTRTCGGISEAALILGWHRNTLHTAIRELKINVRPFRLLPKRALPVRSHDVQEMRA